MPNDCSAGDDTRTFTLTHTCTDSSSVELVDSFVLFCFVSLSVSLSLSRPLDFVFFVCVCVCRLCFSRWILAIDDCPLFGVVLSNEVESLREETRTWRTLPFPSHPCKLTRITTDTGRALSSLSFLSFFPPLVSLLSFFLSHFSLSANHRTWSFCTTQSQSPVD